MTRTEKIEEFLRGIDTEIDILNCVDVDSVESFDDLVNQIDESQGFDIEIIYYSVAMEYLSNNDASLQESLGIASEMGFDCSSLNSETLASLLASREVRNEFIELEGEIDSFFDDVEDDTFNCPECDTEYNDQDEADECCNEVDELTGKNL